MVEIGTALVGIAVLAAAPAAIAPRRCRAGVAVSALALVLAAAGLARSLWTLDLSIAYVADHARGSIGAPYRIAGLWGGASGSLLLFAAMVALVCAIVTLTRADVIALLSARWGGATVAALGSAVLLFANPFGRLEIPAISGSGLQPILEHPAMLYHPPLLYAGMVSTIAPWLVALASSGEPRWRSIERPLLALSLVLLTVGQLTGSNWAYVELGWGGFWGWDPVENGVLVAWLFTVAAIHVVGQPGHDRAVAWLCSAPWITVLVCTTVTRAGIGESVHAFADDARVSSVLAVTIAGSLAVTALRLRRVSADRRRLRRLPTISAVLVSVAALAVLEGVLFPLVAPGQAIVSGHFYASVLAPLAILALAMSTLALGAPRWWWSALGAVIGLGLGAFVGATTPFALAVAAGVGAVVTALLAGLATGGSTRWSIRLGHIGFAVLLIGVAGSTQQTRTTVTLFPGERTELAGVDFTHLGVDVESGPTADTSAVVASLEVAEAGRAGPTLRPALVSFSQRSVLLAEAALDSRLLRDIQVVLRTAADDGSARYDITVTPLVQPVWWGAGLMALAGVVVLVGRLRPGDREGQVGGDRRDRLRSSRVRSSSADIVADSPETRSASSARATSSRSVASCAAVDDSVDADGDVSSGPSPRDGPASTSDR